MTSSVESLYEMFLSDPDIVATATKSREEVAFGEAKQRFIQSMNNHKALSLAKSGRLEDLLSYLRYGNLMKGPKDTLHVFGTGESIGPGSAFPSSRITHRMPEAIVNPRGQIRYPEEDAPVEGTGSAITFPEASPGTHKELIDHLINEFGLLHGGQPDHPDNEFLPNGEKNKSHFPHTVHDILDDPELSGKAVDTGRLPDDALYLAGLSQRRRATEEEVQGEAGAEAPGEDGEEEEGEEGEDRLEQEGADEDVQEEEEGGTGEAKVRQAVDNPMGYRSHELLGGPEGELVGLDALEEMKNRARTPEAKRHMDNLTDKVAEFNNHQVTMSLPRYRTGPNLGTRSRVYTPYSTNPEFKDDIPAGWDDDSGVVGEDGKMMSHRQNLESKRLAAMSSIGDSLKFVRDNESHFDHPANRVTEDTNHTHTFSPAQDWALRHASRNNEDVSPEFRENVRQAASQREHHGNPSAIDELLQRVAKDSNIQLTPPNAATQQAEEAHRQAHPLGEHVSRPITKPGEKQPEDMTIHQLGAWIINNPDLDPHRLAEIWNEGLATGQWHAEDIEDLRNSITGIPMKMDELANIYQDMEKFSTHEEEVAAHKKSMKAYSEVVHNPDTGLMEWNPELADKIFKKNVLPNKPWEDEEATTARENRAARVADHFGQTRLSRINRALAEKDYTFGRTGDGITSPGNAQMRRYGWASKHNYKAIPESERHRVPPQLAKQLKLPDGRSIADAYAEQRDPTKSRKDNYTAYKKLWETWADANPEQLNGLARKAQGKTLYDMSQHASGTVIRSAARALSEILNERYLDKPGSTPTRATSPREPSVKLDVSPDKIAYEGEGDVRLFSGDQKSEYDKYRPIMQTLRTLGVPLEDLTNLNSDNQPVWSTHTFEKGMKKWGFLNEDDSLHPEDTNPWDRNGAHMNFNPRIMPGQHYRSQVRTENPSWMKKGLPTEAERLGEKPGTFIERGGPGHQAFDRRQGLIRHFDLTATDEQKAALASHAYTDPETGKKVGGRSALEASLDGGVIKSFMKDGKRVFERIPGANKTEGPDHMENQGSWIKARGLEPGGMKKNRMGESYYDTARPSENFDTVPAKTYPDETINATDILHRDPTTWNHAERQWFNNVYLKSPHAAVPYPRGSGTVGYGASTMRPPEKFTAPKFAEESGMLQGKAERYLDSLARQAAGEEEERTGTPFKTEDDIKDELAPFIDTERFPNQAEMSGYGKEPEREFKDTTEGRALASLDAVTSPNRPSNTMIQKFLGYSPEEVGTATDERGRTAEQQTEVKRRMQGYARQMGITGEWPLNKDQIQQHIQSVMAQRKEQLKAHPETKEGFVDRFMKHFKDEHMGRDGLTTKDIADWAEAHGYVGTAPNPEGDGRHTMHRPLNRITGEPLSSDFADSRRAWTPWHQRNFDFGGADEDAGDTNHAHGGEEDGGTPVPNIPPTPPSPERSPFPEYKPGRTSTPTPDTRRINVKRVDRKGYRGSGEDEPDPGEIGFDQPPIDDIQPTPTPSSTPSEGDTADKPSAVEEFSAALRRRSQERERLTSRRTVRNVPDTTGRPDALSEFYEKARKQDAHLRRHDEALKNGWGTGFHDLQTEGTVKDRIDFLQSNYHTVGTKGRQELTNLLHNVFDNARRTSTPTSDKGGNRDDWEAIDGSVGARAKQIREKDTPTDALGVKARDALNTLYASDEGSRMATQPPDRKRQWTAEDDREYRTTPEAIASHFNVNGDIQQHGEFAHSTQEMAKGFHKAEGMYPILDQEGNVTNNYVSPHMAKEEAAREKAGEPKQFGKLVPFSKTPMLVDEDSINKNAPSSDIYESQGLDKDTPVTVSHISKYLYSLLDHERGDEDEGEDEDGGENGDGTPPVAQAAPADEPGGANVRVVGGTGAVKQAHDAGEGVSMIRPFDAQQSDEHYGNPFGVSDRTSAVHNVGSTQNAVNAHAAWLHKSPEYARIHNDDDWTQGRFIGDRDGNKIWLGEGRGPRGEMPVKPEQRDWILGQIQSGALNNKDLLYHTVNEDTIDKRSHAHNIEDMVNTHQGNPAGADFREDYPEGEGAKPVLEQAAWEAAGQSHRNAVRQADDDHDEAKRQGWGSDIDVEMGHFSDRGVQHKPMGYAHEVQDYAEKQQENLGIPLVHDGSGDTDVGTPHADIYKHHGLDEEGVGKMQAFEEPITLDHVKDYIKSKTGTDAPKADWEEGEGVEPAAATSTAQPEAAAPEGGAGGQVRGISGDTVQSDIEAEHMAGTGVNMLAPEGESDEHYGNPFFNSTGLPGMFSGTTPNKPHDLRSNQNVVDAHKAWLNKENTYAIDSETNQPIRYIKFGASYIVLGPNEEGRSIGGTMLQGKKLWLGEEPGPLGEPAVKPEQRDWIHAQIKAGALDNKHLLFHQESDTTGGRRPEAEGGRTHAHNILDLVNNPDFRATPTTPPTAQPEAAPTSAEQPAAEATPETPASEAEAPTTAEEAQAHQDMVGHIPINYVSPLLHPDAAAGELVDDLKNRKADIAERIEQAKEMYHTSPTDSSWYGTNPVPHTEDQFKPYGVQDAVMPKFVQRVPEGSVLKDPNKTYDETKNPWGTMVPAETINQDLRGRARMVRFRHVLGEINRAQKYYEDTHDLLRESLGMTQDEYDEFRKSGESITPPLGRTPGEQISLSGLEEKHPAVFKGDKPWEEVQPDFLKNLRGTRAVPDEATGEITDEEHPNHPGNPYSRVPHIDLQTGKETYDTDDQYTPEDWARRPSAGGRIEQPEAAPAEEPTPDAQPEQPAAEEPAAVDDDDPTAGAPRYGESQEERDSRVAAEEQEVEGHDTQHGEMQADPTNQVANAPIPHGYTPMPDNPRDMTEQAKEDQMQAMVEHLKPRMKNQAAVNYLQGLRDTMIAHVTEPRGYGSVTEDGTWEKNSPSTPSALGRLQKLENMLIDNDFKNIGIRELAHWGNGNGLYYKGVGIEGADNKFKMFHPQGYGGKSRGLELEHTPSLLDGMDADDAVGIKKLEEQNYNTRNFYISQGKSETEAKNLAKAHREEMWRADHGSRLGYKGEPGGVPDDEVRGGGVGGRGTGRGEGGGGRTGGGGGTLPPTPEHVEAAKRKLLEHGRSQQWIDEVYEMNHPEEADKKMISEGNSIHFSEEGKDRHALEKKEMKVEEAPTFVNGVTDPTHALRTAYVFGHKLREHGIEVSPKVMEGWQRLAAQARHAGGDSKRIEQEMKEFGNDFGGPEHLEAVAKKDDYIRMQTNEVNGLLGNPARQKAAWQDQNHNPHRSHTFDNETGEHTGTRYRQLDGTGKAKKREENYDDVAPGGSPLPGKEHNPRQQKPVVEDPDAPDTGKILGDAEEAHSNNMDAGNKALLENNKLSEKLRGIRRSNKSLEDAHSKLHNDWNNMPNVTSADKQARTDFYNTKIKASQRKVQPGRDKERVASDEYLKHIDEVLAPARDAIETSSGIRDAARQAHNVPTPMETNHGDAPFQPGLTSAKRAEYNQLHKDIQQHKLTAQTPEEREAGNATLDARKQTFHDSLPSSQQGLDPTDIQGSMVNHPHFGALAEEKAGQGNHAGQAWREHHEEKSRLTAEHARVTDELSKLHPEHDAFLHEQKGMEVDAAKQKLDDHVASLGTRGSKSMGMPSPEELKGSNPHGDLEYHEGVGLVSKSAHNQILNNLQGHEGFLHTGVGEDGSGKPLVYHNDGVTPKEGHVLVTHGGVHPVRYNAQYSQEKDDGIDKDDERTLGLGHSIHHAITSEHPDIEHHANGVHIRSLENVTPQLSEHHTAQLAQQAPVSQPTPTTSTTPPTGEKRTALGKLGDFVGSVRRATKAGIQAQPTIGGTARAAGRGIGAANKFAGRMINEQEIATEAGQPAAGGWSGSNVIRGRAGHTPTATGRAVQGLKATFGTSAMKANAAAQHMENVSSVAQSHLQGTTPPPVPKSFGE